MQGCKDATRFVLCYGDAAVSSPGGKSTMIRLTSALANQIIYM